MAKRDRMLIAQVEPPHVTRGGDWYYRTHSPGTALAEHDDVYVVDLTNVHRRREEILSRADIVVLNMVCDPDLLPLISDRRRRGLVTVHEVNDDVACMQPWNPPAAFYANPDHQMLFRMLIRACNGVQFSTLELERIYGGLNPSRAVFPNQIARSPAWPRPKSPLTAPIVVGWGGSLGHLQDIAAVADPLVDWVRAHDDVVLHVMCADEIWSLFQRLPRHKKRRFEIGDIDAYHVFVAGLDIGIAPLEDTGFNRCRSDVKFLEYGLHGVVPVVRALAPYERTVKSRVTGLLFHDAPEMIALLDELIRGPELRSRIAARARAYVLTERSERAHSEKRLEFYRSLLSKRGPGTSREALELFGRLCGTEGSALRGRHLGLDPTRYELLLHQALVLGQKEARREEAVGLLRKAAELEPNAYQPHLFGARMSTCPIEWLRTALEKNPRSLKAHVVLAERLAEEGRIEETLRAMLAAAELYPAYDVPYARLARMLFRWDQPAEAERFVEVATALRRPYLDLGSRPRKAATPV